MYKLSGAVTISGFNVVEAKVSTLNNGMALDILWVRDLNGLMLDKLYHFSKLQKKMLEILSNDNLLEKEMKNSAKILEFEKAALLRDQITELRKNLIFSM